MALTRPRYSNIVDTDYKASCRVVTITNISLSGGAPSTYDGVSLLIGDRILVAAQNTGSQNGIYLVQSVGTGSNGTWVRSFDANDGERITAGLQTNISEGTYAGKNWRLTTPDPITVGVTNLTFQESSTIASGQNRNLQFNDSNALAGATALNYFSANTSLVATGNVFASALYTNQLKWEANNQPITLTGNINPTIYVSNTAVSTTITRVDSLPAAGNTYVRWNVSAKDQVNNRYRFVTIESVNDTANVYYSEYAGVKSDPSSNVVVFTSNVSNGNINLWAVGDSATVYVNFQRTMLGSYAPTGYINNFGPIGPAGSIAETSSNIVTTATSAATSTTTGALQVAGGAGIAGNAYIGGSAVVGTDLTVLGNLSVLGEVTTFNTATLTVEDLNISLADGAATAGAANGAGISVSGPAGAQISYFSSSDAWNLNKDTRVTALYTGSGIFWTGNSAVVRTGIQYTTGTTAPTGANYGDKWYDTSTDILYEWQTGDGANGFWVDVGSLAIMATANLSNQAFNTVSANNIVSAGNITASNVILGGTGSGWIYANNFIFSQNGASIFDSFGVNSYGNVNVAQYLPTYTGNIQGANVYVVGNDSVSITTGALRVVGGAGISGNLNIGSNVNITSNLTVTQSGLFRGPYNENSILSGVFIGNTGTAPGITPRVGFFNGNTQQNWQIDNNAGEFRWFVPGLTRLSLYPNGNLNVVGSLTVGGKKAVNGPAFSAYANATLQTITSGSQQKVLFQTEEFDTDNCYANSRFTPNVEGYYQLNAEVRLDGATGTGEIMIVIWKNGAEYKRGTNQSGTQIASSFWAMTVSSLVYANGTTDFFEIYVQQTSGSSVTVTAVNSSNITWFNGAMVRGA